MLLAKIINPVTKCTPLQGGRGAKSAKHFTQTGTFSILLLVPLIVVTLVLIVLFGFKEMIVLVTLGFVAAALIICLLIFYKLTITIDENSISFRLGAGLVSRKYMLSEISGCRPVHTDIMTGIGIRLMADGWLYNVSGLSAVELTFKNSRSKIRIGTDKAEEISGLVNSMLPAADMEQYSYENRRSILIPALAVFVLALVIPAVLVLSGTRDVKVAATDSDLIVKGVYGLKINYADITHLDTISSLPNIRLRTNGYAFSKTLKGNFRLDDRVHAKLFVKKNAPPYIFIKTDSQNIYLNFRDPAYTLELYNRIKPGFGKEE